MRDRFCFVICLWIVLILGSVVPAAAQQDQPEPVTIEGSIEVAQPLRAAFPFSPPPNERNTPRRREAGVHD